MTLRAPRRIVGQVFNLRRIANPPAPSDGVSPERLTSSWSRRLYAIPFYPKQMTMTLKPRSGRIAAALSISIACLLPLSSQTAPPHALTLPLHCPGGDCSLLHGAPQTAGMRSGFVRLKPGDSVGWHTTGQNEESLVILHGQGDALIEGQPGRSFTAPGFVYIPPATRHNVKNTGREVLEYVYVVAPAGK
jgi:mannose-6-phosphate isomerase-like protein (cupin superfamily)